jgi:hypothetical protein
MPIDSISMCPNTFYIQLAVSLNHDVTTSFWFCKWPRTPKSKPSKLGITVWGCYLMPMDSISMGSHTVYGCRQQFELAVSHNHDLMISFWLHKWPRTPTYEPSSAGIIVGGYCHLPMDSISMCSNLLYLSNMNAQSSGWGACQPHPWCNDIISTPQVTQNPKLWAKWCGYNCLRLLPYTQRQLMNVLKHFEYV